MERSRNFNEFTNTAQLGPEAVILQELSMSSGGGGDQALQLASEQ